MTSGGKVFESESEVIYGLWISSSNWIFQRLEKCIVLCPNIFSTRLAEGSVSRGHEKNQIQSHTQIVCLDTCPLPVILRILSAHAKSVENNFYNPLNSVRSIQIVGRAYRSFFPMLDFHLWRIVLVVIFHDSSDVNEWKVRFCSQLRVILVFDIILMFARNIVFRLIDIDIRRENGKTM